MTRTDFIQEDKFPKQFKPHEAAIKFFQKMIFEEFENLKEGEFTLENGATLFSNRVNPEEQEL